MKRLPPLGGLNKTQQAGREAGMNAGHHGLVARIQLEALHKNPPRYWGIREVSNLHEIVGTLEIAYSLDLSKFRIPAEQMQKRLISARRGSASGRLPGYEQYSKDLYCEETYVLRQIEALLSYLNALSLIEPATPGGHNPPPMAEMTSSPQSFLRELNLTERQKERIEKAEQILTDSLGAHEQMREFWEPNQWVSPHPSDFDQLTEVRKLERDIKTYLETVLNVVADASLNATTTDDLRKRFNDGGTVLRAGAYMRLNRKDLPFLDRASIDKFVDGVCFYLTQKAIERLERVRNPQRRWDGTVEPSFHFQEFPKVKYHWTKKEVTVADAQEELDLGGGWGDLADFTPYRGPRPKRTDQLDPLKWIEEWSAPGLTPGLQNQIRAQILRADSLFWKDPEASGSEFAAMSMAFDGIAKVLFDAKILAQEHLANEIPVVVWDSAIAGGWYRFASATPRNIFPSRLGHYYVWLDESTDPQGLFRPEVAKWSAELLDRPAGSPPLRKNQKGRQKDKGIEELKKQVRALRSENLSYGEICGRLGNRPRPPHAKWRDLDWPTAYRRFPRAVTKWLSEACS